MEEYETEGSPEESKESPRARIAQNLKRQIDTVDERWTMLCQRSEEWQQWIDEVLRVSELLLRKKCLVMDTYGDALYGDALYGVLICRKTAIVDLNAVFQTKPSDSLRHFQSNFESKRSLLYHPGLFLPAVDLMVQRVGGDANCTVTCFR